MPSAVRADAKGVAAFLIIAFGLAWLLWELPLLLGVPANGPLFPLLVVPGAWSPAIACIIVRKWVTREGFADAGQQLNPHKWPYYLAALAVPLAIVAFDVLAAPFFEIATPDLGLRDGAALPFPVGAPLAGTLPYGVLVVAAVQVAVAATIAAPFLWGEEFGWRSYLQIRIFRTRPVLAAIFTGIIWGVWHYPLLLAGTEMPNHMALVLVIFPVATVFYSIIFGWIRNRSGSVWASSLAHSGINNMRAPLLLGLFGTLPDMMPIVLLGLLPLGLISLIIVVCGGLRPPETDMLGKNSFTKSA